MSKKSYIINFFLILVLTALGLWFALRENFEEVLSLIFNLKWYSFALIVMYGLGYNMTIGCIYRVLGKKHKKNYSYREGLQVAFVGSFFSGVTPSATGGQFGQAYILKNQGLKLSEGASILWMDFIIYQTTMLAYTSVLMLIKGMYYYEKFSHLFVLIVIGYIMNSAVIVFLFTMAKFPNVYIKVSRFVLLFLGRIKVVKQPENVIKAWNIQLSLFTSEIKKIKKLKVEVVKCVVLNIFRLTILYSLPFFIAYQLGVDLQVIGLLDVIAMTSFVYLSMVFFPVPGGSGGTEGVFISIFASSYGLVMTNSIMILWRFATYHFIVLIGGLTFLVLKCRYNKLKPQYYVDKNDYLEEGDNI